MGYDVHKLTKERDLIIGGVKIPLKKGFSGIPMRMCFYMPLWMLCWGRRPLAISENISRIRMRLFGGISSLKLLEHVGELLDKECFLIENIDATIIAQAPKMRPYIDKMRENIANTLGIDISQVNVKATTEEGLGFTGSGEGISSQAICLLTSPVNYYTEDVTAQEKCTGCKGCPKEEGKS